MKCRFRWVGIASLAMLVASSSLAQNAPPDSGLAAPSPVPVDTPAVHVAAPAPAPAVAPAAAAAHVQVPAGPREGAAPGRGGVGGSIGGSWFNASDDYSAGSQIRFDFSGRYRYVFTPKWRFQVSPEFTWSAYSKTEPAPFIDPAFPADTTKEHYLSMLLPVSLELQMTWGKKPWLYFLGFGPGAYRVWVEHHRKVLRDPDPTSLKLHRGVYWGFTAELGAEKFLKSLPNTSIEASLAQHYAFAQRDEQFPSGWNSAVGALALRIGGNYYFEPRLKKEPEKLPKSAGKK